jgi:2-amino-4-hydroxy-6-hydroxymethyldihydropteridine diphosphokinase
MVAHIYLLLGSNLGNRDQNLRQAIHLIQQEVGKIVCVSGIYETAAWGKTDQHEFLNQIVQLESSFSPEALLTKILSLETLMGRTRTEKWGERTIDIDILYYGDVVLNTNPLTLPHPGIPTRRFVLEPLCEIAPEFIHPGLKKSNAQLLTECQDPLAVKKID